jgi:galactose-1-phosphate uridylyltransferase
MGLLYLFLLEENPVLPNTVEEEWQNIKESIQTAAKEVIRYKNKEKHKEWFSDECKQALDIQNKARMMMLQKETRTTTEEYKEAHKICRNKRKEYEEEKLQSLQAYNTRSESRKFYQEVRRFKEGYQP